MSEFFLRLKERKLVQWAVAYVAAAFALLQGVDIVAQRFAWPDSIERTLIIAACVGFFLVLVLAWYHGERGAQKISGTELLIIGLVLAVGGGLLWRFASVSHSSAGKAETATNEQRASFDVNIPAKSIAVLPFESLSSDKDNAYFAEGVQDEILTRLAQVADLKVISRTSTQHFKSSPDNLPEIARQLGVAHILEGSVQKAHDQVRVNVQLIKAATDAHLWADTYDRKLLDIFTVESEIAKTIADTLQAKLSGSEETAIAKKPTANPEAYELYLKGRFFWNKRNTPDLRKSIDFFHQAIAKDANYALAYAGLAQAWMVLPAYNGGAPAECTPPALAAVQKALALDENLSDAVAVLASVKAEYDFDFPGARAEYERAIRLNPNDATARHWFASDVLASTGDFAGELTEMKRALELDPLSLVINTNLGNAYLHNGRLDEAAAQFRKSVELDTNFYFARWSYGLVLELQGKHSEAIAQYEKAAAVTDDPIPWGVLGRAYGMAGRKDEARTILVKLRQSRAKRYTAAFSLALVNIGLGDRDEALNWLEESYRERDGNNIAQIRIDPLLASLHGDPRFEALAEKIVPAREFGKAATASK